MLRLAPFDLEYPRALLALKSPPTIECSRALEHGKPRVAIVGARDAHPKFRELASELATACARRGAIVLSGGAAGIDSDAHTAALDAGGVTWLIAPHGREARPFPVENAPLHERILQEGSAIVWPFEPTIPALSTFHRRNEVLVALADVVVAIHAGTASGTLHCANRALAQKKPLWVAAAPPWLAEGTYEFGGTFDLLEKDATRVLRSVAHFVGSLRSLPPPRAPRSDPRERAILEALEGGALHRDHVLERAALAPSELAVALFTLELEGLVRERDGVLELTS